VVLVFHDVTDRRELEKELVLRAERLAEAGRRKDEFLAMLAHELRSPLAPLRNALYILGMPEAGAELIERSRRMMERQLQNLVRLVDDLLDVSRILHGKVQLHLEEVDLAAVVARAAEAVQPLIEAGGLYLSVSVPPEPLPLLADPTRLEQVLANLLSNAAKFTGPGGAVELSVRRGEDTVTVTVADSGEGIPPDLLPQVFDPFTQGSRSLDRSQGGLGIGLTLVRSLVEMHGGTVTAHSEGLGKGSRFLVHLPFR
jgi:two-component system CheB/CheR fusion protein